MLHNLLTDVKCDRHHTRAFIYFGIRDENELNKALQGNFYETR